MVQILLGRKDRKEISRACLLAEDSTPLTCRVYVSKFVFKTGIPKSKSFITYGSLLSKKMRPIYRITRNPPNTGLYLIKLCGTLSPF